ncbi:MAG: MaoC/PaaZ C-terminal domain-containing protein [Gordonia sp. (in: high G+C Gram-positive bacteria)]|uniref:MaoC/PaaZ C-terminal domain-containing protein n=1 Tax=Gordonia sp. (in: high G+C Gram-positive bacteria) TaxID=84139 RepID=UPI003C78EB0B
MTTDPTRPVPAPGDDYFLSDWFTLDREHLQQFAWSTYLDPEHVDLTVSHNNPLGADLVDGFWQVSMLLYFHFKYGAGGADGEYGFNYGLDRVRFPAPLMLGQRIRVHCQILAAADHPSGTLVTTRNTMEVEGQERPCMVADLLLLRIAPQLNQGTTR